MTRKQVASLFADALLVIDEAGQITDVNERAEALLGWPRREIVGERLELVLPQRLRHMVMAGMESGDLKTPGGADHPEFVARHRGGWDVPVEATLLAVGDDSGRYVCAVLRDNSARQTYEANLARHAMSDPLTGLPNRSLLIDRLQHAVDRLGRQGGLVGVLFLDVDRFKFVNDSLGHSAGDELILAIARRLTAAVREQDTVARFGGDEFVLLCEDARSELEIEALATRLIDLLAEPVRIAGRDIFTSVSIGIAIAQSTHASADGLLRDADAAMYGAKGRGGGRYERFDGAMRARAAARLEVEAELHRALERDELRVFYQPIMGLGESGLGVEAVVRWQHPSRGIVPPAEFIALAEETGLIEAIDGWVLDRAVAEVAKWRETNDALADVWLSVNVSARHLNNPTLVDLVAGVLSRHDFEPAALTLEITETALMDETQAGAAVLASLRRLGLRIAVDDFGTGYSSLLYLRRFPLQILKIDRFFVAGLNHHPEDRLIIGALVDLAHSLGMVAVAEGAETAEQVEVLKELGCDLAQGYFWAPALPADEVVRFLEGKEAQGPEQLCMRPGTVANRCPNPRVLLVDDSAGDRNLLRLLLEASGSFQVVAEAQDGLSAVDSAAEHQPDIVLLDLAMPGVGGLEAVGPLRDAAPRSSVVILSGVVSPAIAQAARAAGAFAALDKSIPACDLLRELTLAAGPRGGGVVRRPAPGGTVRAPLALAAPR